LSGDPNQNFLAEGLRLGILSSLVQLSGLFLIGTDAVDGYRNQDVSAAKAGAQVGVRYVLGGTVQRAGNRLRATIQITDVAANAIVWSEHYDRDIDDVFKMQDEITQSVLVSLNVKLLGGESTRIWFDGIADPRGREHYHRAISHIYAGTKDDNIAALRQLHELHRIQSDTDHASSFIAMVHLIDAMFGWSESEARSLEQSAKWAEIAVRYEENNGIGHVVLGYLSLLNRKHDEALASCERAIGIRPSCSLAHGILASVRNYCGDSSNAIKNVREALLLERIYPPWMINILAAAYRDSGKVRLSIPAAREALRLDSQQTEARVILCSDYNLENARDDARQIAQEIIGAEPTFRLSTYAAKQPYKYGETLDRVINVLRDAGLPD
jgi:TolB-like protein